MCGAHSCKVRVGNMCDCEVVGYEVPGKKRILLHLLPLFSLFPFSSSIAPLCKRSLLLFPFVFCLNCNYLLMVDSTAEQTKRTCVFYTLVPALFLNFSTRSLLRLLILLFFSFFNVAGRRTLLTRLCCCFHLPFHASPLPLPKVMGAEGKMMLTNEVRKPRRRKEKKEDEIMVIAILTTAVNELATFS
ncbi:hypothetical protein Tb11.02.0080 [Trypanosoma brucei brucei TREU927]|uniref:Uncharacterized protein n=1 Tax=Trypanosoma brucei brucei (strain 927/4 GUTat10.1) TaxID=185431 RepID=Q386R2_TRYB2|nr:hypothetical protein Tb11.02.0080 [Trypanosoma brucei brucei TREU927]EAN79219.1 hypothetical protein Tb11.02.0080 [Trypanosoma brucei brucei TREU927]